MNVETFVKLALEEDLGDGDHTSLACIPDETSGEAKLLVKDSGIIAGVDIAEKIFNTIDSTLDFKRLLSDGNKVEPGNIVFYISGNVKSILKGERLVLNCMQRMSAIATKTCATVQKLEGLKTKVLDTRKTTPLLRFMEKEAVRIGGGTNHRFGLYDMIMIKDNHIDYAGGIENAIQAVQDYIQQKGKPLHIVVEARDLKEVNQILEYGQVDRILLDNFDHSTLKEAVALIGDKMETEASGGITYQNVRDYAECGVDFVSMGELTHSVSNFDLSLKAV